MFLVVEGYCKIPVVLFEFDISELTRVLTLDYFRVIA